MIYDASALLALIFDEPGSDVASRHLGEGSISAVNLAEVASLLAARGASDSDLDALLADLPLAVIPFDGEMARWRDGAGRRSAPPVDEEPRAVAWRSVCLALGRLKNEHVLTDDRAWAELASALDLKIELIR